MNKVKKPIFFILTILILLISYLSVFGIKTPDGTILIKGAGDIRWGIDIRGGVEATFSPMDGMIADNEELEAAKAIIELRMVSSNITDYELYTDSNNNRIIVRFPWKSDEADFNPEEAVNELAATAQLTFRKGMEFESYYTDENGETVYTTPTGETKDTIYLDGSDIESAQASVYQDETGATEYGVSLTMNEDGVEKFKNATEENVGQIISIWMDDVMISYPTVNSVIADGKAQITGSFDAETATDLANKIQGGALPFALETTNIRTINPTLGLQSLEAMQIAGVIAFALVAAFMIFKFRLPGVVSVITIAGQIGLTFAAISGFFPAFNSFTLTLPGIAGIILSVGIGVDANIIAASRIKEELYAGKTLDGAIYNGCKNSFSAVVDGNITIIIVSIMLIGVFGPGNILSAIFGESTTGAIYSFGFTLLVGVIGNFIMAVFASRMMIKSLTSFKAFRKKSLFGYKEKSKKLTVDFYKNRKIFFGISASVLLVGVVFNVVFGAKLDIQFAGGAVITYSVNDSVDEDEIASLVEEVTGREAEINSGVLMATNQHQVTVSFSGNEAITPDTQKALLDRLNEEYGDKGFTLAESNSVDPAMGAQFLQKSIACFGITVLLLLAYIAMRFKKIGGAKAGLTAILALVHDVLIIYFVFIIFGMGINEIFIAVVLTILGYSLNDTIVIYDRIRENNALSKGKKDMISTMNTSLNQTLERSVLTSVTTLIALLAVFVVSSIYGLDTVSSFALPMAIGVISGCYSSLFVAAPVFTMWHKKGNTKVSENQNEELKLEAESENNEVD